MAWVGLSLLGFWGEHCLVLTHLLSDSWLGPVSSRFLGKTLSRFDSSDSWLEWVCLFSVSGEKLSRFDSSDSWLGSRVGLSLLGFWGEHCLGLTHLTHDLDLSLLGRTLSRFDSSDSWLGLPLLGSWGVLIIQWVSLSFGSSVFNSWVSSHSGSWAALIMTWVCLSMFLASSGYYI
jgi:hypothetical protein